MKYYIYIDESGDFGEAISKKKSSVVGGISSRLDSEGWAAVHRAFVFEFNKKNKANLLYPVHFHCAPLLTGKLPETSQIPEPIRQRFVEEMFHEVVKQGSFGLASINRKSRFAFSRQATYGINLVAALKAGLLHLAQQTSDCDALEIVIAQRTIGETRTSMNDSRTYMEDLLPFLQSQLASGGCDGARLTRKLITAQTLILRTGRADLDPGLMAADFICQVRNKNYLRQELLVKTEPNDLIFGDYEAFYEVEVQRLIESSQYAAAISIAHRSMERSVANREIQRALDELQKESDVEILRRELAALLAEAHLLIEKRTLEPFALEAARKILESLISIARPQIFSTVEVPVKRAWADMLVHALVDLTACHNHSGDTEHQTLIEKDLQSVFEVFGTLISITYHQRKEILLEAKTRNLNVLFNDYRFTEVIDSFESDVQLRETEIPEGVPDELLGKMLGTLGQAWAFLARIEPEWAPTSRDYFERSKRHFAPGTLFHSMTVNYLTTLALQEGQVEVACREMNGHTGLPQAKRADDITNGLARFLTHKNTSAFDAVNYLRIVSVCAELGRPVEIEALKQAVHHWLPLLQNAHPYEQICKWFAYQYYLAGEYDRATDLCKKGIQICDSIGFTGQTISLSIIGLNVICRAAMNDRQGLSHYRSVFENLVQKLLGQSKGFGDYIHHFGGTSGMSAMIDQQNRDGATQICRFLPFSYL